MYYVLYVLLLYYVLIQIIHACWQPVALGAPTSTGRRLQQYLLRANSSFLWNQDIIHGILTVSVPILPFWGQDIMAYLSVPILPSWGQDITAYLSVPIPPLKNAFVTTCAGSYYCIIFQRAVYYVL